MSLARLRELEAQPLRAGRKVGRTLYLQLGPEPSDNDPLVGLMDTRELAAEVVAARNLLPLLLDVAETAQRLLPLMYPSVRFDRLRDALANLAAEAGNL